MNFLISNAQAQSSSPAADPFGFLLPMAAIFIVFYFLLIRPQQKRQKAHAAPSAIIVLSFSRIAPTIGFGLAVYL